MSPLAAQHTTHSTRTQPQTSLPPPPTASSYSSSSSSLTHALCADAAALPPVSLASFAQGDGADTEHCLPMERYRREMQTFLQDAEAFMSSVYLSHLLRYDAAQEWHELYYMGTERTDRSTPCNGRCRGSRAMCERRCREVKERLRRGWQAETYTNTQVNACDETMQDRTSLPLCVTYATQPYWLLLPRRHRHPFPRSSSPTSPQSTDNTRDYKSSPVILLLSTEWLRWLSETLVQSLALLQRRLRLIARETTRTITRTRSQAPAQTNNSIIITTNEEEEHEQQHEVEEGGGEESNEVQDTARRTASVVQVLSVRIDGQARAAQEIGIALQAVQLLWLLLRLYRAGLWACAADNTHTATSFTLGKEALRYILHSSNTLEEDAHSAAAAQRGDITSVLSVLRPEGQLRAVALWLMHYITQHMKAYEHKPTYTAYSSNSNNSTHVLLLVAALRDMMADVGDTLAQNTALQQLFVVPEPSDRNTHDACEEKDEKEDDDQSYSVLDALVQCLGEAAMGELRDISAPNAQANTSTSHGHIPHARGQTPSALPAVPSRVSLSLLDTLLQHHLLRGQAQDSTCWVQHVQDSLVHLLQADQLLPADTTLQATADKLVQQQQQAEQARTLSTSTSSFSSAAAVTLIDWARLDGPARLLQQPRPYLPRSLPLVVPVTHLLLRLAGLHTSPSETNRNDEGEEVNSTEASTQSHRVYLRAVLLWLLRVLFARYRAHMLEDTLRLLAAYFAAVPDMNVHTTNTSLNTHTKADGDGRSSVLCVDEEAAVLLSDITDALLDRTRTDMPVSTPALQAALLEVWFVALPHCRHSLAEKFGRLSFLYLSAPVCYRLRCVAALQVPRLFARFARRADRVLQDLMRVLRKGIQQASHNSEEGSTRTSTHVLQSTSTAHNSNTERVPLRAEELVCATSLLALAEATAAAPRPLVRVIQREVLYAVLQWAAASTRVGVQDLLLQCLQRLSYDDDNDDDDEGKTNFSTRACARRTHTSTLHASVAYAEVHCMTMMQREHLRASQLSLRRVPLYARLPRCHGEALLRRWLWQERRSLAEFPCWCLGFCDGHELALHYMAFLYPLSLTLGMAAMNTQSTKGHDIGGGGGDGGRHIGLVCSSGGELQRTLLYVYRETHCEDMAALTDALHEPSNIAEAQEEEGSNGERQANVCHDGETRDELERTALLLTLAQGAPCIAQLMMWAQEFDKTPSTTRPSAGTSNSNSVTQATRRDSTRTSQLVPQQEGGEEEKAGNTSAFGRAARTALTWLQQSTTWRSASLILPVLGHVYGETTAQVYLHELHKASTSENAAQSGSEDSTEVQTGKTASHGTTDSNNSFVCLLRVFADDIACTLADLSTQHTTQASCEALRCALSDLAQRVHTQTNSEKENVLQAWLGEAEGDHVYILLQHLYRRLTTHMCPTYCEYSNIHCTTSESVVCSRAGQHTRAWLQLLRCICLDWLSASPVMMLLLVLPHVFRTVVMICLHLIQRYHEDDEMRSMSDGDVCTEEEKTDITSSSSIDNTRYTSPRQSRQAIVCDILEHVWLRVHNPPPSPQHTPIRNDTCTTHRLCSALAAEVATTLCLLSSGSPSVRRTWQRLSTRDARLQSRDWRVLAMPFLYANTRHTRTSCPDAQGRSEDAEDRRKDEEEVIDVDDMTEAERTSTQQQQQQQHGAHTSIFGTTTTTDKPPVPPQVQALQQLLQLLQVGLEQDRWRMGLYTTDTYLGTSDSTMYDEGTHVEQGKASVASLVDCAEVLARVVDGERSTLAQCIRAGCVRTYHTSTKTTQAEEDECRRHTCTQADTADTQCTACAKLRQRVFATCTLLAIHCHRACIGSDTPQRTASASDACRLPGLQLLRSLTWCFIEAGQLSYLETLVQLASANAESASYRSCMSERVCDAKEDDDEEECGLHINTSYLEALHVEAVQDRHAYHLHMSTSEGRGEEDEEDERDQSSGNNNNNNNSSTSNAQGTSGGRAISEADERTAAELMNAVLGRTCVALLRRLCKDAYGADSTRAALASAALRHWLSHTATTHRSNNTCGSTGSTARERSAAVRSDEDDAAVFTAMLMTLPRHTSLPTHGEGDAQRGPVQSACEAARRALLLALSHPSSSSSSSSSACCVQYTLTAFQRLRGGGSSNGGDGGDAQTLLYTSTRIEDLPTLDDDGEEEDISTLWKRLQTTQENTKNEEQGVACGLVLALLRSYSLARRFTLLRALIPLLRYEADTAPYTSTTTSTSTSSNDVVCEVQGSLAEYILPLVCALAMLETRSGREGRAHTRLTGSPSLALSSAITTATTTGGGGIGGEYGETAAQRAWRAQWSKQLAMSILARAADFPRLTRRLLQGLRLCQAVRMRVVRQAGLRPRPPGYYTNSNTSYDAYNNNSASTSISTVRAMSSFAAREENAAYYAYTSNTALQAWLAHLTMSLVGRVPWIASVTECYWLSDISAALLARAALAIRAPVLAVAFVELSGESVLSARGGICAASSFSPSGLSLYAFSAPSAQASAFSAFGENTSVSVLFPWATSPQVQGLMAADNAARQRTHNNNNNSTNSSAVQPQLQQRASRSRTRAAAARERWLSFYRVVSEVYARVQAMTCGELFGEDALQGTYHHQHHHHHEQATQTSSDATTRDAWASEEMQEEVQAMSETAVETQLRCLEQLTNTQTSNNNHSDDTRRETDNAKVWAVVQRARVLLRRGLLRSATELLLGGAVVAQEQQQQRMIHEKKNSEQVNTGTQGNTNDKEEDKERHEGVRYMAGVSEEVRALCRSTVAEAAWRCGQWWPSVQTSPPLVCESSHNAKCESEQEAVSNSNSSGGGVGAELREVVRRWLRGAGPLYTHEATNNNNNVRSMYRTQDGCILDTRASMLGCVHTVGQPASFHEGLLEAMSVIHDAVQDSRRSVHPSANNHHTNSRCCDQVEENDDDDEDSALRAWRQLVRHVARAQRGLCAAPLHAHNWASAMFALEALSEVEQCGSQLLLVQPQGRRRSNSGGVAVYADCTASKCRTMPHWLREYGLDDYALCATTTSSSSQVQLPAHLSVVSHASLECESVPYSAWGLLDTVRYGLCQLHSSHEWTWAVLQGCARRALRVQAPHLAQRWLNDYLGHLTDVCSINTNTPHSSTCECVNEEWTPSLERRVELTLLRAQAMYDLGSTRAALGLLQRAPNTTHSLICSENVTNKGDSAVQAVSRWWNEGLPAEACTQPRVVHRLLSWCEALRCAPLAQLVRDPLLSHCVVKDQSGACSFLLARLCHTLAREIATRLKSHAFRQLRRSIVTSRRVRAELERQLQAAMNNNNNSTAGNNNSSSMTGNHPLGEAHNAGNAAARVLLSSSQCKLLRHRLRSLGLDIDREEAELRQELENYALYRRSALNAYARYLQLVAAQDAGDEAIQAVFGFHELWLQAEDEDMVWSNDITEADMNNNNNNDEDGGDEGGRGGEGGERRTTRTGRENMNNTNTTTTTTSHRPLDRSVTEKVLRKALHYTPTGRFLPLFAQLAAQLAGGRDEERVEQLVRRIAQAHPLQTMWPLLALAHGRYFGPHNAHDETEGEGVQRGKGRSADGRERRRAVLHTERNDAEEREDENDEANNNDNNSESNTEDEEGEDENNVRRRRGPPRRAGPTRRMIHRVDERKVAVAQGILRDLTMHLPSPAASSQSKHTEGAQHEAEEEQSGGTVRYNAAQRTAQMVHDASRLSAAYLELAAAKIPSRTTTTTGTTTNKAAMVYHNGLVRPAISQANAHGEYAIAPGLRILADIHHLCIPPPTLTLPPCAELPSATSEEAHAGARGGRRGGDTTNNTTIYTAVLPESVPTIHRFRGSFTAPGGINHPKLLQCELSDGTVVRQLLKSNDDLRQDSLIEQVFRLANTLFARASHHTHYTNHNNNNNSSNHDPSSVYSASYAGGSGSIRHALRVYTYNVVPLAPTTGLVQWVHHTIAYGEYIGGRLRSVGDAVQPAKPPRNAAPLLPTAGGGGAGNNNNNNYNVNAGGHAAMTHQHFPGAHERYFPSEPTTFECREALAAAPKSQKVSTLLNIYTEFSPALHYFFLEHYDSAEACYVHQQAYTRSVAAASIVGYIVGLGDRHGSNLLLHERRAELIHIDLGIAFDQNKFLPIPELVPFRLTRNVVDGLGVRGTEGGFRGACAAALHTLRTHRDLLLTILRAFVHDPLANWVVQPLPAYTNSEEEEEGGDDDDDDDDETNDEDEEGSEGRQQRRSTRFIKSEPPVARTSRHAAHTKGRERSNRGRQAANQKNGSSSGSGSSAADAERALARVDVKLSGQDGGEQLTVETQVGKLIQAAQSVDHLAHIYVGWSPWL